MIWQVYLALTVIFVVYKSYLNAGGKYAAAYPGVYLACALIFPLLPLFYADFWWDQLISFGFFMLVAAFNDLRESAAATGKDKESKDDKGIDIYVKVFLLSIVLYYLYLYTSLAAFVDKLHTMLRTAQQDMLWSYILVLVLSGAIIILCKRSDKTRRAALILYICLVAIVTLLPWRVDAFWTSVLLLFIISSITSTFLVRGLQAVKNDQYLFVYPLYLLATLVSACLYVWLAVGRQV